MRREFESDPESACDMEAFLVSGPRCSNGRYASTEPPWTFRSCGISPH